MESPRHTPRGPHEARRRGARADADENALRRRPNALNAVLRAVYTHLRVDALGRQPQRQLAQRDEVALAKEILDRARRLIGDVYLSFTEPFEELVRRQIDEANLARLFEHLVRDRLANEDARHLRDDVIEAFDVLDVERRVDVDAGVEELFDVLPPLGVARSRRVRVRELVDEEQPWLARERGVDIELLEHHSAVLHLVPREHLEADDERPRVVASVRLDDADDHVAL